MARLCVLLLRINLSELLLSQLLPPDREDPDGALSLTTNRLCCQGFLREAAAKNKSKQKNRKSSGSPAYVLMRTHATLIKSRLQPANVLRVVFVYLIVIVCNERSDLLGEFAAILPPESRAAFLTLAVFLQKHLLRCRCLAIS